MPSSLYHFCAHPGCTEMVCDSAMCEKHTKEKNRIAFGKIKIPQRNRDFYNSPAWRKTSLIHRQMEPLCRPCKVDGLIRFATLVHHEPSLTQLFKKGLDPLDHRYLISICHECHTRELAKHRKKY